MSVRLVVDVPDDWIAGIEERRGEQGIADYLRALILADLPKSARKKLTEPRGRGRPPKAAE